MRVTLLLLRAFLLQALADAFVKLLGRVDAVQLIRIQSVGLAENLLHQRIGFGNFLVVPNCAVVIVSRSQRLVSGLDQRAGNIAQQLGQELAIGLTQFDCGMRTVERFDQRDIGRTPLVEQGLQFRVITLAPARERYLPGLQFGAMPLQVAQQSVEALACWRQRRAGRLRRLAAQLLYRLRGRRIGRGADFAGHA
ncbi:hypothetical protein ACFOHQ_05680 [Xanthomonas fragariae]